MQPEQRNETAASWRFHWPALDRPEEALFWMLFLAFWSVIISVYLLINALAMGNIFQAPISLIILHACTGATALALRRTVLTVRNSGAAILGLSVAGVALIGSTVSILAWQTVCTWELQQGDNALAYLEAEAANSTSGIVIIIEHIATLTWIQATFGLLYAGFLSHLAIQETRRENAELEARAHAAQLNMLRFQLNPHFLFNTLNAISDQVIQNRLETADEMIIGLSRFFRHTLDGDFTRNVTLDRELDAVRLYLQLEQARFGDRLKLTFEVEDDAHEALVPGLILQPLAENAIKHGISRLRAGGEITIRARRCDQTLLVEVENSGQTDGDTIKQANIAPDGVGITNVRERLRVLHGPLARLDLEPTEAGGCLSKIQLPFKRVPLDDSEGDPTHAGGDSR